MLTFPSSLTIKNDCNPRPRNWPNPTLFRRSGQLSVRLFYRLQWTSRTKPYTLSPIGPIVSSFVLPFTVNQSHQTVHIFSDRANCQFVCFTVFSEPVAPNRTRFRRSGQLSVRLFYRLQWTSRTKPYALSPIGPMVSSFVLPFTVNQLHQTVHSLADRSNGQFVCFIVYSEPVAQNRTLFGRSGQWSVRL